MERFAIIAFVVAIVVAIGQLVASIWQIVYQAPGYQVNKHKLKRLGNTQRGSRFN